MGKRRNAHLLVWLASAAASLLVLGLAAAGPAQAVSAVPGARPGSLTLHAAHAARTVAAKRTQPAARVTQGRRDARQVCPPAKRGFFSCMSLVRTNVPGHKGLFAPAQTPAGYGPPDLQSAYNLPSATAGSGQTVAIVDAYDDPTAEADLTTYRAQYGLPACTTANGCFTKVNQQGQQGTYPAPDPNWATEISLDLDMVSAICPNCHILLVEANSNNGSDLYAAENEAVALGAKYVSNSWGGCEYSGEQGDDQYFNHPGVVITAAGGDYGYLDQGEGCGTSNWPAASPYVTAVGGTTLTSDSTAARGWNEAVWSGTGSGCSILEPKPTWQHDPGCPNRMTTDVSAVANPNTGVALYDSYNQGGWLVVGGTSVATPIIASVYALAGPPAAGTKPASYPYGDPSALNDITAGSNGTCTPAYLCTAGPGYDGPTGLGAPNGVTAFLGGPHGQITGKVTSRATGSPIAGATVSTPQGYSATTNAHGGYLLAAPAGSYNLTAARFGYAAQTVDNVRISHGSVVTENFNLPATPTQTLSGIVTDGSGHQWPLYAKISISGDPNPVYTNPYTGAYHVSLPQRASYTLQATAGLPGYVAKTVSVHIGSAGVQRNIQLSIDPYACTAPGYHDKTVFSQPFNGGGTSPPPGWSVTNKLGSSYGQWTFNDPEGRGNWTGGQGGFAIADSGQSTEDTVLTSPVFSLAHVADPSLSFDTGFESGGLAEVDLSTDGGQTWSSIWQTSTGVFRDHVSVQIPQAGGQAGVRVRFHFTGISGNPSFWEVSHVVVNWCNATAAGGLVEGQVTDGNTGDAINGATVASAADPKMTATTAAAAGVGNGYYWLFISPAAATSFTATDGGYASSTATVNVAANAVSQRDWALQAGHLTASPGGISVTEAMGASKTATVTLTNTGTQSVHVQLGEEDGGFTPLGGSRGTAAQGLPLRLIKGHFSPAVASLLQGRSPAGHPSLTGGQMTRPGRVTPADAPWADVADYPITIMDNAVAENNGKVYSVGGASLGHGIVSRGYMYDPAAGSWTRIANAPVAAEAPAAASVNGTMYLAGGWNGYAPVSATYAYHPSSNSWTQVASMPQGLVSAASAVVGGRMYVVGGCTTGSCSSPSDAVYSYDPGSNTWTKDTSYPPGAVSFASCAGLGRKLVCAGGTSSGTGETYRSTWIYDPASSTWTQGAAMTYAEWGATYGGANGQLVITGGVTDNSGAITNQAAAYDPATNTWTALPNAYTAEYRGGGACGFYTVGGDIGTLEPSAVSQVLPQYNQCGGASWLKEGQIQLDVAPGQTVHVPVTLDASQVSQPGTYTALLTIDTNTPYTVQPVSVSMHVNPPSAWGKITGTVTDVGTGKPIGLATVRICTRYNTHTGQCGPVSYTLTTGTNGSYNLWLDKGYNPLLVDVSAHSYQLAFKVVKIGAGATTTANFALSKS